MSTEPDQPTEDTTNTTDDQPPAEPPIVEDETKPEDPQTPPPPESPSSPIVFEPATWYAVTSACTTESCPNLNTTTTEPMVYSNAGTVIMICARCGKQRQILSATKLDPQPEMS